MRIPNGPPDAARMARAQAELGRIEARLRRDALKADVIARIVSDMAKNKDILDRPAVLAALTQDPDSMMELARQAGWLGEEPPVTGTEMRRAGTLLGRLLNAFQVPEEQGAFAPARQSQADDFVRSYGNESLLSVSGQAMDGLPGPAIVAVSEPATAITAHRLTLSKNVVIEGNDATGFQAPPMISIQRPRTGSLVFFSMIGLAGMALLGWLYL
jgi:hypothetical protein